MESIEEKNAIEYLKVRLYGNEGCELIDVAQTDLRIFLKLVEKQQKEIEALKQEKEYLNCIIESDKDNYINKDKIREKIKELEITRNSSITDNGFTIMSVVISNFKELLEEK